MASASVRFVLVFLCILKYSSTTIVNQYVTRVIDIKTQIIKIRNTIVFKNEGPEIVKSYEFVTEPNIDRPFVLFFNEETVKLEHEVNYNNHSFQVIFDRSVKPNETYKMIAELAYVGGITPYYKTRKQGEVQVLLYKGNVHFYSLYATTFLQTTYICKSDVVVNLTLTPHSQKGNQLVFRYFKIEPYSLQIVNIRFETEEPVLVVTELLRTIDVSHFGKIIVEDKIILENKGSKLIGPYEPLPYQLPKHATSWLYTHLPASAANVEFFDEIGNNSKSQLLYFKDYTTFKYQPRYPLLGGWKTQYTLRYSVPVHEYLSRNLLDYFYLKIRAIDHVLNEAYIKKSTVKILLPEGAFLVQVKHPNWFDAVTDEVEYTTLCLFGRSTVILNGSMLLENHISNVKITYLFSSVYLLRVPLLIALYLQVVFFVVILFRRLVSL